jgi:hypothetical protein
MAGSSIHQTGSSNSLLSPEVSIAPSRKRQTPDSGYKTRFVNAAKRVAQGISNALKPHTNRTSVPDQAATSRRTTSFSEPHTTRTVKFSSTVASSIRQAFPYQVSHTYSAGVQSCQRAPSVSSLLPQLAGSLANKQGFVYIRDESGPSPVAEFVEAFRSSGSVDLGNGCKLIRAYAPPPEKQSVFSPNWSFQIYDSNLEAIFEVPVTEVLFTNLADPNNRTEQLIHLNNCMDTHLRSLPDAFKDSPECPTIICPELPRVAQLLTAQEECLGRQHRGELNCRESIDWICAGEDLLQTISPESPKFQGEESCDFESFFRRTGVYNIGEQALPFSIGHPKANLREAGVIRGYKRHLPNIEATASTSRPVRASPVTTQAANTAITAKPQWLHDRDLGQAYKEPVQQMQCASQTINSLLQRHAITPEITSAHIAANRVDTLHQLGMDTSEQKGLTHPKVMAAMINGQSVEISKREFMGQNPHELDIATEQTPIDSWQKLVNLSPQGQGRNWFNNARELNAIDRLHITPDMWLSAQRGTETSELLGMLNGQLQSNQEKYLPREMIHWPLADHRNEIPQLEHMAQRALADQKDFPIVVRTGNESGHFQTIVPDSNGNWLTLNSDATRQTGVQPCNRWCNAGDLAASFHRSGVSDILIPKLSNF